MSKEHRDKVLANASIVDLTENHQRDVLMKRELTLQQVNYKRQRRVK